MSLVDSDSLRRAGERFIKVSAYILLSNGVIAGFNSVFNANLQPEVANLLNAVLAAVAVFLMAKYPSTERVL